MSPLKPWGLPFPYSAFLAKPCLAFLMDGLKWGLDFLFFFCVSSLILSFSHFWKFRVKSQQMFLLPQVLPLLPCAPLLFHFTFTIPSVLSKTFWSSGYHTSRARAAHWPILLGSPDRENPNIAAHLLPRRLLHWSFSLPMPSLSPELTNSTWVKTSNSLDI